MELKIGDIFWLKVQYPSTGEIETRPVVVYALQNGDPLIASFATITRSKITDFEKKDMISGKCHFLNGESQGYTILRT